MNGDHPTDLLPAFALGSLDDQERETVSRHLRICDVCRQELEMYQEVTEHLALGAPPAYPPEALKRRLMMRIAPRTGASGWFEKLIGIRLRLVPTAVLAGLLLVAALAVSNVILWHRLTYIRSGGINYTRVIWLQPTAEAPGAIGTLIVGPSKSRALLLVNDLMPLTAEAQYQLWLIKDGRRTSGAIFSVTSDGKAAMMVVAPHPLADFDAFGITVEPFGGSPGPTGRKVMGGKMKL